MVVLHETVDKFPYVGSSITDDGVLDHELTSCLAKAACVLVARLA